MPVRVTVLAALVVAALTLGACAAPRSATQPPAVETPAAQTEPSPVAPATEEPDTTMATTDDPFAGTSWNLSSIDGAEPIAGGRPATLEFNDEGRVAGSSGCNRFMGGYTFDGTALSFSPLAGTMMACPDELMQQEQTFLKIMEQIAGYTLADDTLTVTDADGRALVFVKA